MIKGQSIIIDLKIPHQYSVVLSREEVLGQLLKNMIEQCKMTYLGLSAYSTASGEFPSILNPTQQGGITVCGVKAKVLGESHIDALTFGAHTWGEYSQLHIDISTCKPLDEKGIDKIRNWLRDHFKPIFLSIQVVPWKVS